MKLLCAVIKPFKLDEVQTALEEIGIQGMTVLEVKGFGRQKGHTEIYRGSEYTVSFLPKIMLLVAIADSKVADARAAVVNSAKTGKIGDGMVWVLPLESIMRIRTEERISDEGFALAPDEITALPSLLNQASAASIEYSAAKWRVAETLTKLGYQVEAAVWVRGSLVDFRLTRQGNTALAIYRSEPTPEAVSYLHGVGEKWQEKILICDGIRRAVEELCGKLNVSFWPTDMLEARKCTGKFGFEKPSMSEGSISGSPDWKRPAGANVLINAPVSGEVRVTTGDLSLIEGKASSSENIPQVLAAMDVMRELLKKRGTEGPAAKDCEEAEQALKNMSSAIKNSQSPEARTQGHHALDILKGTAIGLGKLNDIGEKFGKLLNLVEPLVDKLFH